MFLSPIDNNSFAAVIETLPEAMLIVFAAAIKKGYWPDGRILTQTQVDICREALHLRDFPVTQYCYTNNKLH